MLHIHHSNRLELLQRQLLRQLHENAPANPFAAEPVIVPHAAMRRHLSLAIADAHGVCANQPFAYLAQWLWRQIAQHVPGVADESPFAAATLAWRVHGAFADADFVAAHPRLHAYLRDADALLRYELACEVAALFEQYLIYRADWLQAWGEAPAAAPLPPAAASPDAARQAAASPDAAWQAAASPDAAWQAALWHRIVAEIELQARHPTQAFVTALRRGHAALPPRLHVFALPQIAPQHLQLLHEIGRRVEVQLYVWNPCREYWFDLIDRRRLSHLAARAREAGHAEEGNRLLAAWGKQTQQHIEALVEVCGDDAQDHTHFAASGGASLLAQLHDALLELRAIEPGSLRLADGERSIELHLCHSLTRELEVLHDRLLGLFAADATLQPGEVLVVTPELEAAAPLIDAVFGAAPSERALPYALCGLRRSRDEAPARCLLQLLALAGSRCSASEVFALLQRPPVARRFGLDDDTLQQIHGWLLDAGFHWGLDGSQRESLQLPGAAQHTLDHALQRLFLGYALPAPCAEPFAGVLGAGDAEGTRAAALGALWQFDQALRSALQALRQPQPPAAWAATLAGVLDAFIAPADDELEDTLALRHGLYELAEHMQRGGVATPLPLAVVRAALQRQLDAGGGGGAAGGSINFAAMSALRGLPFKVVCAIGLNDGAFPALRTPREFDLIALHPRHGDRQRRQDDRALMLELLLAARTHLHLSCTGRSVRDNQPLTPSVLVAELLDLLVPAIAAAGADAAALRSARQRLVVEHPLQPFATAAFDTHGDVRLRSHDRELAAALRAQLAATAGAGTGTAATATATATSDDAADAAHEAADERDADLGSDETDDADRDDDAAAVQRPFFAAALPSPPPAARQLTLAQLTLFLRNPCRALLRQRLGIEPVREADELRDDEAFVADARTRRALWRRLLPRLLAAADGAADGAAAADADALLTLARADGVWPAGALGEAGLRHELQRLRAFAARLRALASEPTLPSLTWTLALPLHGEPWQLQAGWADLRASGLLRWGDDAPRASDRLEAWLQHLALCAAAPPGVARCTRWLWPEGRFEFTPCDDAPAQLGALLALVRRGLVEPLHFFPRSAWEYVAKSPAAARAAWHGASAQGVPGEGDDAAYRLALRGVAEPLDGSFAQLAQQVYAPLRRHLRETEA